MSRVLAIVERAGACHLRELARQLGKRDADGLNQVDALTERGYLTRDGDVLRLSAPGRALLDAVPPARDANVARSTAGAGRRARKP